MALKIRRHLLILNYLAAICLVLGWIYIQTVAELGTISKGIALDRAGVINHDNLRSAYPSLADNPRHDLPIWIASSEHTAANLACLGGLTLAMMNIIWLHRAAVPASPKEQPTPTDGPEVDS